MKRTIAFVGLVALCLSLVACGNNHTTNQKNNELIGNEVFSDERMLTVTGKEIELKPEYDAGRLIIDTNVGVGVLLTEELCGEMRENEFVPLYQYESADNQMDVSFIGETMMRLEDADQIPEEEYMELFLTMNFPLFAIHKAGTDENSVKSDVYDSFEEVGICNGAKYFIMFNKNIDENVYTGLTAKDKQNIKMLISAIPEIKKNMLIFPPVNYEDNMAALEDTQAFASFKAKDVFGNEVTDEIIKANELTMINIWATWCGPCVMEIYEIPKKRFAAADYPDDEHQQALNLLKQGNMEDLGKLYSNLPEGVGLLSICEDAGEEAEVVKDILKENNCEFPTLVPSGEIEAYVNEVYSYPTTIFVDKNGSIVDMTSGSMDMDGYLGIIKRLIKQ